MLSVAKKLCTCKKEYPGANQQSIAIYFSLLSAKPIGQWCVGNIISEKRKWENEVREHFKWLTGAKLGRPWECVSYMYRASAYKKV